MSCRGDSHSARELVLERIREDRRFILASHEKPDGDALGSMAAMQGLLSGARQGLGRCSSRPGDLPLPDEYSFFALAGIVSEPPPDVRERTVVFLDCGNVDRNPAGVLRDSPLLLNIDHHHDNTHFGTHQPCRPRRLLHGRDRVGADARARLRAHRRRSPRRCTWA